MGDKFIHITKDFAELVEYFLTFLGKVCAGPAVSPLLQESYAETCLIVPHLAPRRPVRHLEALGSLIEGACLMNQHEELEYPDTENRLSIDFYPYFISEVHISTDNMKPGIFQGEWTVDIS